MTTLFFVALIIQVAFYLFLLYFFTKEEHTSSSNLPGISIIICAKNEAENLKKNLPSIINQNYPNFEILVINDNSNDNTIEVLEQLKTTYNNLKYINIGATEKIGNGKKYIIKKGVELAQNEVLVFTDADCYPASDNWLKIMVQHLGKKDIVLGIAPLVENQTDWVADLQHYETAQTALMYIALAKVGNPYMGVGRNLMITKLSFLQHQWTNEELEIASGDDDLLIQKIANSNNTAVCTQHETFVFSDAKPNYQEWRNQKIRHFSTGYLYKLKDKVLLSTFLISKIYIYLFFIFNLDYIRYVILYLIMITLAFRHISKNYQLNTGWRKIPILDGVLIFNTIVLGIALKFKLKSEWK